MTPGRFTTRHARADPAAGPRRAPPSSVRVEGLSPGTAYGFGLVAVDELDAVGALGAPVAVTTLEATPPANVADLRVEAGSTADRVVLRWTAPGDDGAVGRATRYVLSVRRGAPDAGQLRGRAGPSPPPRRSSPAAPRSSPPAASPPSEPSTSPS